MFTLFLRPEVTTLGSSLRALRRISRRHESWLDRLVELAEAAVPDVTVVSVGARAEDDGAAREYDPPRLIAGHARRERPGLGQRARCEGQCNQNKSDSSHRRTLDTDASGWAAPFPHDNVESRAWLPAKSEAGLQRSARIPHSIGCRRRASSTAAA